MQHYDPTDPDAVAAEQLRVARQEARDIAELRTLLGIPEFRRWLWRALGVTQAFTASYDPDSPLRMAFAEGRRSVGLWLLAELQAAAPGEFATLISEAWSEANPPEEIED